MIQDVLSGSRIRIFSHSGSGSRGQKSTGSRIRIRNTVVLQGPVLSHVVASLFLLTGSGSNSKTVAKSSGLYFGTWLIFTLHINRRTFSRFLNLNLYNRRTFYMKIYLFDLVYYKAEEQINIDSNVKFHFSSQFGKLF
jgi:hypothetical protein